MKIAFVGPFGLRAKMTMAARALPLGKALARRGHAVQMLLPPWDSPADAGQSWDADGVEVVNMPLPTTPAPPFHAQLTIRLLRHLRAFRPDVVHTFKPKAYAGLVAWALWQQRRLGGAHPRLVVDADDWEGAGGWNDLASYSAAQRRWFAWQERWGLTHADALTVASRALQTLVWSLGVPPRTVHYLPNGVDSSAPPPAGLEAHSRLRQQYRLADGPVVLLYTRFFEFSVTRVAEIAQRVWHEMPQMRLLIVGKGFFAEEETLLRLLGDGGYKDRAVYAGWVSPSELPGYFAAADVAIYPFDDTLINRTKCAVKLLDLLMAGVPVVADAVGQNREYIISGESGILVPPGDTATFATQVIRLLRDAALRERLGAAARARLLAEYSWDRLAEVAEQAYAPAS